MKMRKQSLLAIALLLSSGLNACKQRPPEEAAIQQVVAPMVLPEGVGKILSGNEVVCLGSLINSSMVLTAGLCSSMTSPRDMYFEVDGRTYEVLNFIVHPGFSSTANNIALLRLKTPASSVKTLSLANSVPTVSQKVTLIGYTPAESEGYKGDGVNAAITNVSVREFEVKGSYLTNPTVLGGPAIVKEGDSTVIMGIHSGFSSELASEVSVSSYRQWLLAQIEKTAITGEDQLKAGAVEVTPIKADRQTISGTVKLTIKATSGSGISQVMFLVSCTKDYFKGLTGVYDEKNDAFSVDLKTKGEIANGPCQINTMVYDHSGNFEEVQAKLTVKN